MSFNNNAEDIRVEGTTLKARIPDNDNNLQDVELNLDDVLGNDDGRFVWGGQGFSGSAENINFNVEGDANVPVLRAQLRNGNGDLVDADVNLAERIGNNGGQLNFRKLNPSLGCWL